MRPNSFRKPAVRPVVPAFEVIHPEVHAAIREQMKEEIGESVLPATEQFMLQQKYGFVAPQLTASETNLVRREEQRNARNAA